MTEYGSDFHRCDAAFHGNSTISTLFPSSIFYGSGRMALIAVAKQEKWKRLWVPAYFCHEIIKVWELHLEIFLYDDYPLEDNDEQIICSLPFKQGDALLRMNYFGLRTKRTNAGIPIPVIEDHSHALTSDWALNSDADWCIASLRKSLPLAYGGILWSPKGHQLPQQPNANNAFEELASERYKAMELKAHYLYKGGNKEEFRNLYIATEEGLDKCSPIVALDKESTHILKHLDIRKWNEQKRKNWDLACECLKRLEIIGRDIPIGFPFSIVIRLENEQSRNQLRKYLIEHNIFPALLWSIPNDVEYTRCKDFSKRMLSIHCDARYTEQDMLQMCEIINQYDTNH